MSRAAIALCIAVGLAACGKAASQAPAAPGALPPVETDRPNAPGQTPAFPGQTRAPGVKTSVPLKVETIATGLDHPWALAFLPDGRMLVSERSGRLNLLSADGKARVQVTGLPEMDARGQGGLLDVALSPDYATTGHIYWCYAEKGEGGNSTAAARGKLILEGAPRVEQVQVVFRQTPKLNSVLHFGCRFAFAPDGKTFFLGMGERSILPGRRQAQRLDGTLGKVVRLNLDGSIPADNPFAKGGGRPEIWSRGHRNIQSAATGPDGALWTVEHGARGGDEMNRPEKGKDYGWPTITYGTEYSGLPIGAGITQKAGMEQPVYYWDPVIAPSGLAFSTGRLIPEWKGNAFIGSLKQTHLARLVLRDGKVVGEERLLADLGQRIRDVREGPDGALYVLTDEDEGAVLRISPK